VPTHDPADPAFERRRYWRGPVWPVVNALVARGLRDSGRLDAAERLRSQTATLVREGGFAEYFDPIDGTACGGHDFTWTAAVWLAWAGPNAPGYRAAA
jgi:glycogen debranching enzyme